jgi:DNA-binding CsgD family transcriptional regulator
VVANSKGFLSLYCVRQAAISISSISIDGQKEKLSEIEREKNRMVSQKTKKQQQLEWRRHRVLSLLAEDYSQNEIASILQVSPASVSKDVAYLKDQSRLLLRTHLKGTFPLEYQQALANLKSIRRQAREMLKNPETDDRVKARLFIVIKDITESIMNLVLKGDAIDDAISFMEDKTTETIEHIKNMKREQQQRKGQQHQQQQQQQEQEHENVEDQAIF